MITESNIIPISIHPNNNHISRNEIIDSFRNAMRNAGIEYDGIIEADTPDIQRFHVSGSKRGRLNGFYILFTDNIPSGYFGDWSAGIEQTWCSKSCESLTPAELAAYKKYIAQASAKRDALKNELNAKAADKAKYIWDNAEFATDNHPYLIRKKVKNYNLRLNKDGKIIIPLFNKDGILRSLQYIANDGSKLFLKDGEIKGNYFIIGDITPTLYIGEGYSTCSTIHEATGCGVICAFNATNLLAVAKVIKQKYPDKIIIIAGDNDLHTENNPGLTNAKQAAEAIGAKLVYPDFSNIVNENKLSDFNDLFVMCGIDEVTRQLNILADKESQTKTVIPDGFILKDSGLYYLENEKEFLICAPLEVTAFSRNKLNEEWGCVLEFNDADNYKHVWNMPRELIKGNADEVKAALLNSGLIISHSSKAKAKLIEYIHSSKPTARARSINKLGWTDDNSVYVLQNGCIGHAANNEKIIYQSPSISKHFSQQGSLADWQNNIAKYCAGNSRLVLSISAGFAAMILNLVGAESGGINLVGQSSSGKTTALRVASSLFGDASYLNRWKATSNGLESLAVSRNDALLVLDELAQIDPREAGEAAYLLSNNSGKVRANRNGDARPYSSWRLLFLSAAELSLEAHINEGGKKIRAGQEIRMIDLPADCGLGFGIFENLHNFKSGAELSNYLTQAASKYYGTPAVEFLNQVTLPENLKEIPKLVREAMAEFTQENMPENSGGQVQRVLERFALIAAAGLLATHFNITGWDLNQSENAAKACFHAWLDNRTSGIGNHEKTAILNQIKLYFETHADSRFQEIESQNQPTIYNRAGFKKKHLMPDGESIYFYYVLPEIFRNEICKSQNFKLVTKILHEANWLDIGNDGKFSKPINLPGIGKTRCYVFTNKMWEG